MEKLQQELSNDWVQEIKSELEIVPEAEHYFQKQIKALEEIAELNDEARSYAHELLTLTDKETSEFKYSPTDVLDFINDLEE